VTQVMINGRLYDTATMNEVGATPKARKAFYFEGNAGTGMPVATYSHGNGHGD
jgi:hypothetical protein